MTNQRLMTVPDQGQTIAFTREFDAPADLVFRAHVDPDLIGRWVGPRGTSVRIHEWNGTGGGNYRYTVEANDGRSWSFFGSFHEVAEPTRLAQTWEYADEPGHPIFEVITFADLAGGRSRIDSVSVFLTREDRDAVLGDFDAGRDEDFERLDELLPELAVARTPAG